MNTTYLSNLNRYLILNEIEKTFKVDKVDIYNISTASRKQYEIKSYIQLEDDEVFFKLSESNAFFMFLSKILLDRDIKCNNEYLYTLVFYSGLDLLYQKIDYNKPVTVISISYLLSIIDSKYESEKNNNISADKVIYWLTNLLYKIYNTIILRNYEEKEITNIKKLETEESVFEAWCFVFNDYERKNLLKGNRGNTSYKNLYINTLPEGYKSMYEAYCNKPIQYYNNYLYKNNISFQLKILEELNKIGITYSKDLINLNFEHNIDFIKKNLIKKKSILFNKEEELLILLTFITKEEDKNFISRLLEIIDYNSFRDNVIPYLNTIVLKEKKLSIVSNIKTNATLKKKINENTFTTNDIETLLNCHKKKNLVSLNSSNSEYDQFNNNQREADMMSYLSGKYTILEYERNKKDMFIFLALFKETDVFRYKCFFDTRLRQNILGLHNYIGSKLLRYCSFLKHDKKKFLPIKSYNDKNIYYIFYLMNQIQTYNSLEESYKNFDEDLINNLDKLDKSKFNSYANLIKIQKYQSHSTVWIDATSSILQIIGVLTGNTKLRKYTNVLGSNNRKYDIYEYLIEEFINKDKKLSNHKYILLLKKRKFFKYVCMTYIYGSNSVNISKDLKKLFKMDYFLDIKELRKVSSIIIKVLDKEFPFLSTIKKLYKVYNSCIPIKKDIVFYTPSIKNRKYDTFIYNNGKKVEKSYFIKPENKEDKYRDISFVFNKYPIDSKIDIDKKSKAIFVNSIHCIDAFLALFVKANLYKESIHCISVHDSFGINITNYKRCLEIYSSGIKVIDKFSFKSILGLETIDKIYSFLRASLEFAEETEDFEFLFRILRKHYQKVENYNYTSYSKVEKKLLSNDKALIEIKSKLKNNTELNKEQITEIKKNKKNIYYNIKKLKEERNNIMRFYIKKKTPVYAYSKELWIKENYKSIQKLIDNIDIFYDINETEKKNKGIFKYALFPE